MDQTAAVRVKARRAACQAAGSLHLASCQRCMRGGKICSHLLSSSDRLFPCVHMYCACRQKLSMVIHP